MWSSSGTCVQDIKPGDVQESLIGLILHLSLEGTVFHPTPYGLEMALSTRVTMLINHIGSDGLGPVFSCLDDIGGDMIVFVVSTCKALYFDCHFMHM